MNKLDKIRERWTVGPGKTLGEIDFLLKNHATSDLRALLRVVDLVGQALSDAHVLVDCGDPERALPPEEACRACGGSGLIDDGDDDRDCGICALVGAFDALTTQEETVDD